MLFVKSTACIAHLLTSLLEVGVFCYRHDKKGALTKEEYTALLAQITQLEAQIKADMEKLQEALKDVKKQLDKKYDKPKKADCDDKDDHDDDNDND